MVMLCIATEAMKGARSLGYYQLFNALNISNKLSPQKYISYLSSKIQACSTDLNTVKRIGWTRLIILARCRH